MSNEFVYVPIRQRWLAEVLTRLAELERGGGGEELSEADASDEATGTLDAALIRRMYEESQEPHRRLMEYLARHPAVWIYTGKLAEALGLPRGARSLAGMLGAFGRRAEHRYGGLTPWESEWDPGAYQARHRMAPEVAEELLRIATSRGR